MGIERKVRLLEAIHHNCPEEEKPRDPRHATIHLLPPVQKDHGHEIDHDPEAQHEPAGDWQYPDSDLIPPYGEEPYTRNEQA
jgi:hypothetical protein